MYATLEKATLEKGELMSMPLVPEQHPAPQPLPTVKQRAHLRLLSRRALRARYVSLFLGGALLGTVCTTLHLDKTARRRCADARIDGWVDGYADGWLEGTEVVDNVLRKVQELEQQELQRREREKHFALLGY